MVKLRMNPSGERAFYVAWPSRVRRRVDSIRAMSDDAGWYREVLNSDAALYGGSNMGNGGGAHTEPVPAHGYDQSLSLVIPPLAFVMFKR